MAKVLLALDGSEGSMAGVDTVKAIAGPGTHVILVTVLPVPSGRDDPAVTGVPYHFLAVPDDVRPTPQGETAANALDRLMEEVGSRLEGIADGLRVRGIQAESRVVFGEAAEEILRIADAEGVDALAVATHGHTGLRGALLGSVASELIGARRYPVIVAPYGVGAG